MKNADNTKGRIQLLVARFFAYAILIFLSVLCLFSFYMLIIHATRSNAQLQAGFGEVRACIFAHQRGFPCRVNDDIVVWIIADEVSSLTVCLIAALGVQAGGDHARRLHADMDFRRIVQLPAHHDGLPGGEIDVGGVEADRVVLDDHHAGNAEAAADIHAAALRVLVVYSGSVSADLTAAHREYGIVRDANAAPVAAGSVILHGAAAHDEVAADAYAAAVAVISIQHLRRI